MKRAERLNTILDLLAQRGSISVEELMEGLAISPATARRDLDSLAHKRLLVRTHGGAQATSVAYDLPARYSRDPRADAKAAIARLASSLVVERDVVGLCGGTTSTALASALATRDDFTTRAGSPALTIVTNAINIAAQLAVRPNFKIMVTGGVLSPRSYELAGTFADAVVQGVSIDKTFLGVNGIEPGRGPTISDESEAVVNAALASRAREAYVVADASKIGARAFASIPIEFRRLITDDSITDAQVSLLEADGVEVLVAPVEPQSFEAVG